MIRLTTAAMLVFLAVSVTVLPVSAEGTGDVDAVKKTIEDAYVKGIHIERDIPAIRKGFHESFTMTIKKGEEISKMSIADWIAGIERRKKEDPSPPAYKTEWKFPMVDVSGDAAVAKVEIYRDGRHIYSDYMSLYRFEDGWKIVGKIYHDHRKD
ncbi:MAG TPA: nuclear transport factor 2 family protein [Candidatus Krumholzibacterium sp.]|nr:nuclear transport factor 2 family protein [Candidatus Krumholzibacterium sp.]